MQSPPPDPIDSLLNCWQPEQPLPGESLVPDIWRRIATKDARPSGWAALHAVFARTSFAAAFVAACVLLGLFLAETRRARMQADFNVSLVQHYLQSIDPLVTNAAAEEASP